MHFLLIVAADAHQVKHVTDQNSLYRLVEGRGTTQRREYVDFQKPRLKVFVDKDIEAVDFKARCSVAWALVEVAYNMRLHTYQCLDYDILHLCPHVLKSDLPLLVSIPQRLEAPLARTLFIITTSSLVGFELCRLLIHREVRQMHKSFLQIIRIHCVLFRGKSH